jgi:hypothetical protein
VTKRTGTLISAVGLALVVGVRPAAGQSPLRLWAGPALAQWRVRSSEGGSLTQSLSAAGVGFEAGVALRRIGLRFRYAQANFQPAALDLDTLARQAAEAEMVLGVQALPWLELGTAGHSRSYVTSVRRQRWLMWELRAIGQFSILGDAVRGYVEWRPILAADVNDPDVGPWNSGEGAEVGLRIAPPAAPVRMRLGYRLEIQKLGAGARREVVDGLTVSVSVAR